VKKAATLAAAWIQARGFKNVVLEIADDHENEGYEHKIIKDALGMQNLIELAKQTAPAILVSASGPGGGRLDHQVGNAADFILLHFNDVKPATVFQRVIAASKHSKAIVCNEDSKTGEAGARALEAAVNALASWGYANREKNERYPFRFEGTADDPIVYAKMKELTAPRAN
jgi:hypothetical protein